MSTYAPRQYGVILDRYQKINNKEPEFVQYDTESAQLNVTFLENGVPFDIPYTRLVLVVRKPDQKEVYQNIETFSGNTAEVILHNQALAVAGTLQCQIKMYQESKLESTWAFEVKVKPSIGNEEAVESENEYRILHQLIIEVDANIEKNEQAIQDLINKTQESVSESIRQTTESMNQNIQTNNQALVEALKKIDESELVRLKETIEFVQQNKLGINDKASDSALLNGITEDVEANAHTLVKRNQDGNIRTANKLQMKQGEQEIPIELIAESHLKVGTRTVWDNGNLIVETGSWTPGAYGSNQGIFNHTEQSGTYMRIGDMVTVYGTLSASSRNGATGEFRIGGLPFAPRGGKVTFTLGPTAGINLGSKILSAVAYAQNTFIRFAVSAPSADNIWYAWLDTGATMNGGDITISFSATYKIV
ncbi:BppU family phage baseplate upper protein [uncultured Turicibacter sp.]|nr:BppU family phage baseplate upper protein [uncultured Turicibacter sp.]